MSALNKSVGPTENGGEHNERLVILDAGAQYGKVGPSETPKEASFNTI